MTTEDPVAKMTDDEVSDAVSELVECTKESFRTDRIINIANEWGCSVDFHASGGVTLISTLLSGACSYGNSLELAFLSMAYKLGKWKPEKKEEAYFYLRNKNSGEVKKSDLTWNTDWERVKVVPYEEEK